MKYEINPAASTSIDILVPVKHLPKYPECITCGMAISILQKNAEFNLYQIEFFGQLTDSKSKPTVKVSIIVTCQIYSVDSATSENTETLLQDAFIVASKSFTNKVSRDSIMNSYSLCPVDNFGLSPNFFR